MNYPRFTTYIKAEKNLIKNGFRCIKGNPISGILFDSNKYISLVFRMGDNNYQVFTYKKATE